MHKQQKGSRLKDVSEDIDPSLLFRCLCGTSVFPNLGLARLIRLRHTMQTTTRA